jgi:hypothetical protein
VWAFIAEPTKRLNIAVLVPEGDSTANLWRNLVGIVGKAGVPMASNVHIVRIHLRQRHAACAYCKHQREPNEKLSNRLVTVSSPSQIASQGRSLQGNGRAKPFTGLVARRRMERAGRTGRTLSARTLRCACLHLRLTRLAGCTQRAPHRHSRQATRLCLVPLSSSCCRVHCRLY